MKFVKGQSGNPNGRPAGVTNKIARALKGELDGRGKELLDKAIELALLGDTAMLKFLLERLIPLPAAIDDNGDTVAPIEVVFVSSDKKPIE